MTRLACVPQGMNPPASRSHYRITECFWYPIPLVVFKLSGLLNILALLLWFRFLWACCGSGCSVTWCCPCLLLSRDLPWSPDAAHAFCSPVTSLALCALQAKPKTVRTDLLLLFLSLFLFLSSFTALTLLPKSLSSLFGCVKPQVFLVLALPCLLKKISVITKLSIFLTIERQLNFLWSYGHTKVQF